MRKSVCVGLMSCVLIVVARPAHAQNPQDGLACQLAALRLPVLDESVQLTTAERRTFLLFDMCRFKSQTEEQWRDQGFNLELVYAAFEIGVGTTDKFSALKKILEIECQALQQQSASASVTLVTSKLVNVPALKAIADIVRACGLSTNVCELIPTTSQVQLVISIPPSPIPGTILPKITMLKSTKITEGNQQRQPFVHDIIVPAAATSYTFIRQDRFQSFTVDVATKPPICKPLPVVPPVPRYTVTVVWNAVATVLKEVTHQFSGRVIHTHCGDVTFKSPLAGDICIPEGKIARHSITGPQNPSAKNKDCFRVVDFQDVSINGQCLRGNVVTKECSGFITEVAACALALQAGTPYTVSVVAENTPQQSLKTVTQVVQDVSSRVVVDYPVSNVPTNTHSLNLNQFVVTITAVGEQPVILTADKSEERGFRVVIDENRRQLLVLLASASDTPTESTPAKSERWVTPAAIVQISESNRLPGLMVVAGIAMILVLAWAAFARRGRPI